MELDIEGVYYLFLSLIGLAIIPGVPTVLYGIARIILHFKGDKEDRLKVDRIFLYAFLAIGIISAVIGVFFFFCLSF